MKNHLMLTTVAALALALCGTGPAFADSSDASTKGGGMPSPEKIPHDKRTDLTKGQEKVPDEYATTPVRQGPLKEVTDSKWLNYSVSNKEGTKLGKITKVLKDEKTQKIEYVFFQLADSKDARPMQWSRFEQNGDKLVLNATKEELLPSVNATETKDMSPSLAMYMDEIEKQRAEPKPKVGPGDGRGTNRPDPSSGSMGEEKAAGNLGPRSEPPGRAPGFENEAAKKSQ